MLVYVAILLIDFIVRGPLRDPTSFGFPLKPYPDGAIISKINIPFIGYLGQLLALFLQLYLFLFAVFTYKTLPGFQIKFLAPLKISRFCRFSKNKIIIYVLLFSGGMSGVAGFIEAFNMGNTT